MVISDIPINGLGGGFVVKLNGITIRLIPVKRYTDPILIQCVRRWPNIEPTFSLCIVSAGLCLCDLVGRSHSELFATSGLNAVIHTTLDKLNLLKGAVSRSIRGYMTDPGDACAVCELSIKGEY